MFKHTVIGAGLFAVAFTAQANISSDAEKSCERLGEMARVTALARENGLSQELLNRTVETDDETMRKLILSTTDQVYNEYADEPPEMVGSIIEAKCRRANMGE
jgi:hypothetical protein